MIQIGPITIMRTRERRAYRDLANAAYALHQAIWYAQDLCSPVVQQGIRKLDEKLSEAISHTPASDIE